MKINLLDKAYTKVVEGLRSKQLHDLKKQECKVLERIVFLQCEDTALLEFIRSLKEGALKEDDDKES